MGFEGLKGEGKKVEPGAKNSLLRVGGAGKEQGCAICVYKHFLDWVDLF